MAKGLTTPSSIINFVELALSIIVAGLIGNQYFGAAASGNLVERLQVVAGVTYGYLIINIIVVAAIILKDELPKNTRLLIAGSAVVLYLTSGALILEFFDKNQKGLNDEQYGRCLSAGIFSIALSALFLVDLFFGYKS